MTAIPNSYSAQDMVNEPALRPPHARGDRTDWPELARKALEAREVGKEIRKDLPASFNRALDYMPR